MSDIPNYQAMSPGDMLEAVGDDAHKWAQAFCQQFPAIDAGTMIGWFANAIEHSGDVRHWRLVRDDERLADHIEQLGQSRLMLRELGLQRQRPGSEITAVSTDEQ